MSFNYSDPSIKKLVYKIVPVIDYIKTIIAEENLILHGSYFTTNIGDRTIAIVLKNELKRKGYKSIIVSHYCSNPPQRNIIVGGGGIMHNQYEHNLELRTNIIKGNNNVIYIGIGCPGFIELTSRDRENIAKLKMAKFISLRDSYSQNLLQSIVDVKTEILACPAWLIYRNLDVRDFSIRNFIFRTYYNLNYSLIRKAGTPKNKKTKIGVILNGHFNLQHLSSIKLMLKDLEILNNLIFIPFVGEDLEFFKRKLSDLDISCKRLTGPIRTYKTILKMDKIIATRYHSVIFSILAEKPVMVLAYSQKVISLAEDLRLEYSNLTSNNQETYKFNESIDKNLVQSKIDQSQTQISRILSNLI